MSNVNQLDATLSGIQLDGSRFVRIEASGLAFFDVATLRCLTTFARTVKQTGREISTCGAPPVLHDVARILDLSDELGLS
jgi:anti-anti-sigma regulatory factor